MAPPSPTIRGRSNGPSTNIRDRITEQLRAITDDKLLTPSDREQWIRQLDHVCFVSDGYLPFPDNIDHARRHGVRYVAEPGGSMRSGTVQIACQQHGITLVHTGLRLFRH